MEYATREQAQQAVNTLSNQNLMGRLVYVREVSSSKATVTFSSFHHATASEKGHILTQSPRRTAKPSHASQGHLQLAVVTKERQAAVASAAVRHMAGLRRVEHAKFS